MYGTCSVSTWVSVFHTYVCDCLRVILGFDTKCWWARTRWIYPGFTSPQDDDEELVGFLCSMRIVPLNMVGLGIIQGINCCEMALLSAHLRLLNSYSKSELKYGPRNRFDFPDCPKAMASPQKHNPIAHARIWRALSQPTVQALLWTQEGQHRHQGAFQAYVIYIRMMELWRVITAALHVSYLELFERIGGLLYSVYKHFHSLDVISDCVKQFICSKNRIPCLCVCMPYTPRKEMSDMFKVI